jgi:hypothetical protein
VFSLNFSKASSLLRDGRCLSFSLSDSCSLPNRTSPWSKLKGGYWCTANY